MKIETHTHCKPVSVCAHHQPEEFPQMLKDAGVDAFVLTNHCYPYHMDKLSDNLKEQAKIYIDVFHQAKKAGEQIGLKAFFGCELKLINEPYKPEFLLYGLSEEDFLDTYPLYNEKQKSVFEFCNEKNILMIQAHPFRSEQGYQPADVRYMHGIEVYNPHPSFDPKVEDALKLAEEYNLLKTAGSDFHVQSQAGNAGLIVPDDTSDQFMLRDYIKSGQAKIYSKDKKYFD